MSNLNIEIELQALITERKGMKAANKKRLLFPRPEDPIGLAYAPECFRELADKMRALLAPGVCSEEIELTDTSALQCSLCDAQCTKTGKIAGDICERVDCPGILGKG